MIKVSGFVATLVSSYNVDCYGNAMGYYMRKGFDARSRERTRADNEHGTKRN